MIFVWGLSQIIILKLEQKFEDSLNTSTGIMSKQKEKFIYFLKMTLGWKTCMPMLKAIGCNRNGKP